GVIGDYDLQSSATAEHLSDADLHKSTFSEPDTALEELDLLPTDSIEQEKISETIVNSKQACTPAVDRSIDAESVDEISSKQTQTADEPSEFPTVSLEPEASTEDPLSQSKVGSQESQPIL